MCVSISSWLYRTQCGLLLVCLLWAGTLLAQSPHISGAAKRDTDNITMLLNINGAIGPAMHDYIQRGLSDAAERRAQVIILQIDTPGGLDVSMRKIIQEIIASPVPVVSFVAPGGARAASAGPISSMPAISQQWRLLPIWAPLHW